MRKILITKSVLMSALLMVGTISCSPLSGPTRLTTASGSLLKLCDGISSQFNHPNTRLESMQPQAAGVLKLAGKDIPAHCLVKGKMNERKGSDGRDYAVAFEMRLPENWNGRFFYQGNGGLDGNVVPALGATGGGPLTGALMQGFAVISSDAGHTGAQNGAFGLETQARLDYGYQAVGKLTPMAKELIRTAYGKAPDRSYIGGCSNGGRHAMVAAARYGEQFDGYLVGAPGYRLPHAALAQLAGAQTWAPLMTSGATTRHPFAPNVQIPDLSTALNEAERRAVGQAILQQCDALDGAVDGMVQATQACQTSFKLDRLPTCAAGALTRDGSCLSSAQKQALAAVQTGFQNEQGKAFYVNFPWDPGIAGRNWAQWKFVNAMALDPGAIGSVFAVPPLAVDSLRSDVQDLAARSLTASDGTRESGMSLMSPPGHETGASLDALWKRGAKMVIYHGVSDAIFSAEDTRQWWERLNAHRQGQASDVARYFPVVGMNHCSAGPAADQFDLLMPLVRWVEQGLAPQAVPAQVRGAGNAGGVNDELPAHWSAQRARPLCAYPSVARYKGSGSLELAENFVCQ